MSAASHFCSMELAGECWSREEYPTCGSIGAILGSTRRAAAVLKRARMSVVVTTCWILIVPFAGGGSGPVVVVECLFGDSPRKRRKASKSCVLAATPMFLVYRVVARIRVARERCDVNARQGLPDGVVGEYFRDFGVSSCAVAAAWLWDTHAARSEQRSEARKKLTRTRFLPACVQVAYLLVVAARSSKVVVFFFFVFWQNSLTNFSAS